MTVKNAVRFSCDSEIAAIDLQEISLLLPSTIFFKYFLKILKSYLFENIISSIRYLPPFLIPKIKTSFLLFVGNISAE